MSMFGDYLWKLLNRPFKLAKPNEYSDTKLWVDTIGQQLDELQKTVFKMRRSKIVATADNKAIDLCGRDRGITRYPGELDKYYRRRVQSAYTTYQQGSTNAGIKKALSQIGYPEVGIYEIISERARHDGLARYDGSKRHAGTNNRWAEFDIKIFLESGRQFEPVDFSILLDTIMKTKAAHAKPRFLTLQYNAFEFKHNGARRYRGEFQHHPSQVNLEPYFELAQGRIMLRVQNT